MIDLKKEIFFRFARSGGKGGQNVNKVETLAEACWDVKNSKIIDNKKRELIFHQLKNRINKDGILLIRSSEARSQLENKIIATEKLLSLVEKSLYIAPERKATKASRNSIEKRLESKKRESQKKEWRKKVSE